MLACVPFADPPLGLPQHSNRQVRFAQQVANARDHVIPFVEAVVPVEGKRVLEVGCGEGGVLKAFADERGCEAVGVDLSPARIAWAEEHLAADVAAGRLRFVAQDVYAPDVEAKLGGTFDVIVLKDAIEHIPDQGRLLRRIATLLRPGGVVFIGFPPWRMPYGGHQQITAAKLGKLPWLHLLPRGLYAGVLRRLGEPEHRVQELLELRDTRLSIHRFERLLREAGYETRRRRLFLLNPIYAYKFGWPPVPQLPVVRSLPFVRDFVTTCCYYVVAPRETSVATP